MAEPIHHVRASSFADPADVRAFRRCKAQGHSDQYCYGKGDSGVGCWMDDCSEGSGPAVALPPEKMTERWGSVDAAKHKKVLVAHGSHSVVATLKDRMPHEANIRNGAGIDLNPDTCKALGLTPPVMTDVTWSWQP